jgi:hypothetical protein
MVTSGLYMAFTDMGQSCESSGEGGVRCADSTFRRPFAFGGEKTHRFVEFGSF